MLVPLARRLQAWPPLTHTGPPMNAALIISLMLLQAPDLQTRFPVAKNTYHDGNNDIVVIDYQSMNLPTSFLRIAKVLPGGMLLPVWLCSSGFEQLKMGEAMITNLPFSASRVTSYLIGGADHCWSQRQYHHRRGWNPDCSHADLLHDDLLHGRLGAQQAEVYGYPDGEQPYLYLI